MDYNMKYLNHYSSLYQYCYNDFRCRIKKNKLCKELVDHQQFSIFFIKNRLKSILHKNKSFVNKKVTKNTNFSKHMA